MPRKRAVSTPDIESSIASFLYSRFLLYTELASSSCLLFAFELAPSKKSFATLSEVLAHPDEITEVNKIAINLILI